MSTEQFLTPSVFSQQSVSGVQKQEEGGKALWLNWGPPGFYCLQRMDGGLHAAPGSLLSLGLTHSSMFLVSAMTCFIVSYSSRCAAAVLVLAVYSDGVV